MTPQPNTLHALRQFLLAFARLLGATCVLLISLLLLAASRLLARGLWNPRIKRWWANGLLFSLGIRLNAHDIARHDSSTGSLLVCNHISFIDILAISAVVPADFVSKSDVANWPILGWMASQVGTIYIERENRRAAHRTQELMVDHLCSGRTIAIFPEGTTTEGDSVLPFHSALFQAAVNVGSNVRCFSISYHETNGQPSRRSAYVGDLSLFGCLWNIVANGPLEARITDVGKIHSPLPDRRRLAHQAHQLIAHALSAGRKANSNYAVPHS